MNIYYTYDDDDRLTGERWLNAAQSELYAFEWDYDEVGNRSYQRYGTEQTYYTYNDANELTQTHEITADEYSYYSYDPNGNLTLMDEPAGLTYFEYTPANLVSAIRYPSGICNYFHYDAMLRRYAIEDSDGLRYLTWDANGMNLLMEKDINGNVTAIHTHGYATLPGNGSRVCAEITSGGTTYYRFDVYDRQGTQNVVTDPDGNVTRQTHYNAFGQVLSQALTGPDIQNRFGYHTNWFQTPDGEGVYHSPTRTYLGKHGIFLQRDPLAKTRAIGRLGVWRNTTVLENIPARILLRNRPPLADVDGQSLYQGAFAQRVGIDPWGEATTVIFYPQVNDKTYQAATPYMTVDSAVLKQLGSTSPGKTTILYSYSGKCEKCPEEQCWSIEDVRLSISVVILLARDPGHRTWWRDGKKLKFENGDEYTHEKLLGHEQMHAYHMLRYLRGKLNTKDYIPTALKNAEGDCDFKTEPACNEKLGKLIQEASNSGAIRELVTGAYGEGGKHGTAKKRPTKNVGYTPFYPYSDPKTIGEFKRHEFPGWLYVHKVVGARDDEKIQEVYPQESQR